MSTLDNFPLPFEFGESSFASPVTAKCWLGFAPAYTSLHWGFCSFHAEEIQGLKGLLKPQWPCPLQTPPRLCSAPSPRCVAAGRVLKKGGRSAGVHSICTSRGKPRPRSRGGIWWWRSSKWSPALNNSNLSPAQVNLSAFQSHRLSS